MEQSNPTVEEIAVVGVAEAADIEVNSIDASIDAPAEKSSQDSASSSHSSDGGTEADSVDDSKKDEHAPTEAPKTSSPSAPQAQLLPEDSLFALPLDAWHSLASFLTPAEWSTFGQTSSSASKTCTQILRRARWHGFRCATEVVAAWKAGHHADAQELAALYTHAGVPIYPQCLGHAYHTILWRMKLEAQKMKRPDAEPDDPLPADAPRLDPFYAKRGEMRLREGYKSQSTYVEEKAFFLAEGKVAELERTGLSRFASRRKHPTARLPLRVHHHLLDQHRLGRLYIQDHDGTMRSSPLCLSADFFHPSKYQQQQPSTKRTLQPMPDLLSPTSLGPRPEALANRFAPVAPVPLHYTPDSLIDRMDISTYDSVSTTTPSSGKADGPELHWRTRFDTYQRRLEGFQNDHEAFEECLLDFWDEWFPHSAGIHYHDLHTPVPRLSNLHNFLTKPLPKELGTIQCEIERIKTSSRGKGMKGRFFPAYEYRLFIRNRPPEGTAPSPDQFVRKDTVLMAAKSRGKKHLEATGVIPMASVLKKGSNNYYLHMPQQADVDAHFQRVNPQSTEGNKVPKMVPNGASHKPVIATERSTSSSYCELLGRLQSNFIGTEFQIFTPHWQKRSRPPPRAIQDPVFHSPSDDELDYDSGMSSDTSRKNRRFRRRKKTPEREDPLAAARPVYRRSKSCSDLPQARAMRGKRVAIANASEHVSTSTSTGATSSCPTAPQLELYEEESGVITYTANLLGSRPRIMDVCVPKVTVDCTAAAEWKTYLESCPDEDDCRMLRCFRQLQQSMGHDDAEAVAGPDPDNAADQVVDDTGDDQAGVAADQSSENTPNEDAVEDFGLLPLQNRPPWWNVELASYVLNFGGRVSVASVKNFQLCHRQDPDTIMLQFGRIQGRHAFTMDFQHPLTAVQAFSIAISSLQSKISFG